ncbi:aminotransferase class I/II-fold pyridoxal phosphate-dependent enzyme [bacterium]|nr:aminotransferase class I/II-fold pyridoxal phosphate-dependent enzyme [bacterium]MBU1983591.1 aminotransferase class I/II-fold pyridoxal phosphate-dependent enzyme [bacterium]
MSTATKINPAHRTKRITYAVRDIVVLANEVAKTGKEMLYLNIGDPNQFDFETPRHIVEAICQAMLANQNGYSPSSGIKPAIQAVEKEAHHKGIRNVLDLFITTGASEAIEICLTALVNAGENVLIPEPGYPLYNAILAKLDTVENPYYLDEANGWQPNLQDIASKINDKTRAIVVINPNNPTGSVCDVETLQGLIRLAHRHNLVIFADEIYDKMILDGKKHVSTASLDPDVSCVTFNGLSKSYVAPGFRIGWGIVSGNETRMRDYIEAINKILRARLCANHPIQHGIAAALGANQEHFKDVIPRLVQRRDITVERLNAIPGISCVRPEGAFYAFPRLYIEESDEDFVKELIRATGVVVVPGAGFGQVPGTHHFRVVFLPPENVLEKAFDQIGRFMSDWQKRHGR